MNETRRGERAAPPTQAGCPVCGRGPLVPIRGQLRCAACHWALCVGCEPAPEAAEEEAVTLK